MDTDLNLSRFSVGQPGLDRPSLFDAQTPPVRHELRCAVRELSIRGLKIAAKWAGEQLIALATDALQADIQPQQSPAAVGVIPLHDDRVLVAKSLFDVGEYERAGLLLRTETSVEHLEPLTLFLRAYTMYLAGEKRREEERSRLVDPLEQAKVANTYLRLIQQELAPLHKRGALDGFGLYIYGVVLRDDGRVPRAQVAEVLVQSVRSYPWNWSAWLDLAGLALELGRQPEGLEGGEWCPWMFQFFLQHLHLEQQQSGEALQVLQDLSELFPNSSYILAQQALAHYHASSFEQSHEAFKELQHRDPTRLEHLDTYSNILYIKEARADLSQLAHAAMKIDKYRPETCCVVGNYYSIKGQHERAVTYFQRALKLDGRFLSAWTLMGHEYMEMKNTPAAVEAYRRAASSSPKDHRPWYGLGQAYEILQMHLYALYYYSKAAAIRPYDARMWVAMGSCYEKLHRTGEAIKAFERANCSDDREGLALIRLAKLYSKEQQRDKAAQTYTQLLRRQGAEELGAKEGVEALLFLAYYHKDKRQLHDAARYAERLLEYPGPEKDDAKALLREIRSLEGQGEGMADRSFDSVMSFEPSL